MANGFDKLEKFFSLSRRKDRALQEKLAARNKTSIICPPCSTTEDNGGPLFPLPSFMTPTSTRMQPRIPTYEMGDDDETRLMQDKGRSRSLCFSNQQHEHWRRSSAYIASEAERKTRSYGSNRPTPSAVNQRGDAPATPRLSGFHFPEDSLFRPASLEDASSPSKDSGGTALLRTTTVKTQDGKLQDWSPKHVAVMFDSLDLSSMTEELGLMPGYGVVESMILMPSPLFTPPREPPPRSPLRGKLRRTPRTPSPRSRSRSSPGIQDWKFSLFPKQYSVLQASASHVYSPSASDSEEDRHIGVGRPRSLTAPEASDNASVKPPPEFICMSGSLTTYVDRSSSQQTSDARLDDPRLDSAGLKNSPHLDPRLNKTESAAALSDVATETKIEYILQEPTIDDIYALSDEDIAESSPPTPTACIEPPDLPRDIRNIPKRHTPTNVFSTTQQKIPINPKYGEMTPPETPTDPQFLTPMPASHSARELGAIMVAGIAKKYNFDLVYLVSLWPNGSGNHLDPSLPHPTGPPLLAAAAGGSIFATPKSKVTGRYLAAFGLSEVAEPFRIHTKVLLRALRTKGWNEYRDTDTTISRGWTCSFDGDYVPLSQSGLDTRAPSQANNRGIVFAAYTKHYNESAIPSKASPEKKECLQKLHTDVKVLVDALIMKAYRAEA
ncbi:hypothetical protein BJ170DRAFT_451115 [Xylariales sp. AK1849]|nr:hypothetical protein BJ170DRAFT_451115 [Xylariales sp. AK1849]